MLKYSVMNYCMPADSKIQTNNTNISLVLKIFTCIQKYKNRTIFKENTNYQIDSRRNRKPEQTNDSSRNWMSCQMCPLYRGHQAQMVLWLSFTGSWGHLLSLILFPPKDPCCPKTVVCVPNPKAWVRQLWPGLTLQYHWHLNSALPGYPKCVPWMDE